MASDLAQLTVMWLGRAARLVAGVALLLAAALLLLQTAPAKRWIADELSAELSDATGYSVSVGSIEGRLPFSASALDVVMADAQGEWLRLQRLDLAWSPFALLSGRLQIDSVIADRVALSRMPLSPPEKEESADGLALDLRLPQLPWPTRVEDIRIGRFEIAPAVLGEPAAVSLAGRLSVENATDAALDMELRRVDTQAGHAAIALRMAQEPAEFALKADLAEPAGGLIARLLKLPGLPPVELSLDGTGPAADWRGKLAASAGDAALDVDLGIGYGLTISVAADGRMEPGRTLQAGTDLLPPAMETSMRVQWQPGHRFAVEQFKLASTEAQADISGVADLDADQIQADVNLRVSDAARWRRWFAPLEIGAGRFSGSLSGALERPQFKLSAAAENLALPEGSAQRAKLEATGSVGIRDLHLLTDLALDANGGFEGLAITDGEPWAAMIGPSPDWSVKGTADLQAGDLQIDTLSLKGAKAEIGGSGSLGAFGQRIAASLNSELTDIAPLARLADFDATGAASLHVMLQRQTAAPIQLTLDGRLRDSSVGDPTLQALLGREPAIAGAVALDDDEIQLSDVKLSGAGGALIANGRTDLSGEVLDLAGDLEVFRIAPLLAEAGITADGHLTATAKVSRSRHDEPLTLTADARVDGIATDSPLAPLIGPGIDGHFDAAYDEDTLHIATATLNGAKVSLTADGTLGDEGAIDYDLRLPELAALTPVVGVTMAGDARATGTVSGAMADPRATADVVIEQPALTGVSLDRIDGQITADKVVSGPTGDIDLTLSRGRATGTVKSAYTYADDTLSLRNLHAATPGAKLAGDLTISPAGLLSGKIGADFDNLKPLGALAGYDLSGAAHLDLDLSPTDGAQGLAANLAARNLAAGEPGGRWTLGRAAMKGRFTDVFGKPGGTADLTVANVLHNGLAVKNGQLTVKGRSDALRFEQSASGTWDRPFSFKSTGEVALLAREMRLRLDRFSGSFDELTAELRAPVTLRQDRGGIAVDDLNMAIAGGTLRGGGRLGARSADFRLSLRNVPLEIAAIAYPDLPFAGEVGADLTVSGPLERPQFKLAATAENLALPEAAAQRAKLDATGSVGIQDLHLVTDLALEAAGGFEGLAITDGEPWAALIGPRLAWSVKGAGDLQAGDLQIQALSLKAATAEIGGSGSLTAFGQRMTAALTSEVADIAPLARLADFNATGAASLTIQLERETAAPMRLTVDGRLHDASVRDPTVQVMLGREPTIAAAVALDDDVIELSDVKLSGAGGELIANGRTDLSGGVLDLAGHLEVFRIAPLLAEAGITADGHLTATAKVSRSRHDEPLTLTADARVDGIATDSPLAPLIGPGIDGHFDAAYDKETLRIASAMVTAAKISLTADGTLGDKGAINYDLRLPELAALTPVLGVTMAGDARATGTVSGPMADPRATADVVIEQLALAGVALDQLTGQLTADKVASAPAGDIALTLSRGRVNGTVNSKYKYLEGALALRNLQGSTPDAKIAGDLIISPAGLLTGKIRASSDNLKPLGALAGYDLAGAAQVALDLSAAKGRQDVAADLTARNLTIAESGGRWSIARAAMKGRFTDVLGKPGGTADLTIADAAHNGLVVENGQLSVKGRSDALRFEQSASGTWDRAFSVESAGEVALLSRETRLRLDRFNGSFDTLTAELRAPATLRQDRGGIAIDDLNMAIAGGTLRGGGRLGAPSADFHLTLQDVPMETAAIAFPNLPFAGEIGADLTVSGPPNRPTALVDVDLADIRERGAAVGESVTLTGQGRLELRDNRGTLQATLKSGTGLSATATGSAPMRFRLDPFELAPDTGGTLEGRVQGQLDLALVPQVIDLYGDSAGGRLDADIAVGGSLARPQLSGEARISNGAYENAQSGAVLRDLEAVLRGAGDRLELVSLSATDGEAGKLSGEGSVRFIGEGDLLYDADLRMTRFKLLRQNDMSATLGGDLHLGRSAERTQLSGKLTIEEAELRIPDRLPGEIARLEVEEVNLPADKATMFRPPPPTPSAPLLLDVTITVPGRSFLRGRGLDSEWRGQLHVSQSLAAPSLVGKLEVARGTIDLFGTIFRIEKGTVTFSGDDDPDLDILAVANTGDELVRLIVTGRASAPKFALSSESGLPSDEILARLMFGKGAGGLSPLQAAQLVQAAAALSGSGEESVVDRLRRTVGIDVLRVESSDQTLEGSSLVIGKYVSDDVLLKMEQGLTPENDKVGVEVRVLPQITVDGDVAATGDSSVGINWRYDY